MTRVTVIDYCFISPATKSDQVGETKFCAHPSGQALVSRVLIVARAAVYKREPLLDALSPSRDWLELMDLATFVIGIPSGK